jgi:DMSO/TMAO reductase YedYZ molybdopterin-dependent catalytic subunit
MSTPNKLQVGGDVQRPVVLDYEDFHTFDARYQVPDVSQLHPDRPGRAVRLAGLLELVGPNDDVRYISLHSSKDDFHASVPLTPIRETAVLIYGLNDAPLSEEAGGPFRFFIPNHAACHTHDIDECANVKFVDRIELTAEKGRDNRPEDERSHAALHAKE